MCEYAFMRTTFDLPEDLFKKAKVQAVNEGVSLKDIVIRALTRELQIPDETVMHRRKVEKLFAALDKSRNTEPVGRLNREELYDRPVLRGH
jgi:hypothetical protein